MVQNTLLKMATKFFIFQRLLKYSEVSRTNVNARVIAWISNGLSNASINPPATSYNSFNPPLDYFSNPKFGV